MQKCLLFLWFVCKNLFPKKAKGLMLMLCSERLETSLPTATMSSSPQQSTGGAQFFANPPPQLFTLGSAASASTSSASVSAQGAAARDGGLSDVANPMISNASQRTIVNNDGASTSRAAVWQQAPIETTLVDNAFGLSRKLSEIQQQLLQLVQQKLQHRFPPHTQQQCLQQLQRKCVETGLLCNMPLCFHWTMGCNVTLDFSSTVASRSPTSRYNGYVVTSRPLLLGESVKLRVSAMYFGSAAKGTLTFGVTSCDPATLNATDWPDDGFNLMDRAEYWIVQPEVCVSPAVNDELVFQLMPDGMYHTPYECWY